ncbi:site-specific integrase [Enterobacter sp.]|uniref:site-specific integrase n=1 Tax=Enterobacter sp. TaxID=42895 RepID=UPI0029700AE4|nr:site-specific integrase [Enterobacter sp.]
MGKITYPTGVENHGGSLRIWFSYKGYRVRENLGVPDTPKNRKVAGELRTSVCYAIKTGSFNYTTQFPDSPNLFRFGLESKEITVLELSKRWMELKQMEIANSTFSRYESTLRSLLPRLGKNKLASAVSHEDLLRIRKDLLTGYQGNATWKPAKAVLGRTVPTVNAYMRVINGMFRFAFNSGYITKNPFAGFTSLKKAKTLPDPLTREEFVRLIDACNHQQYKNLWSLAVYTGMRHGELVALAWEDIDLKAGTIMVRRSYSVTKEFTLPKTAAGTDRMINLIQPAIDVLKRQAELTRVGKQYQIEVKLREYGRKLTHPCTFVFNPAMTTRNDIEAGHYSAGSISKIWERLLKRAGLRHRKAYQSRHTYACWSLTAGANPNFIASQMGHANAQMVYHVYGTWMSDNNLEQITLLNQKLSAFAPSMPPDRLKEA